MSRTSKAGTFSVFLGLLQETGLSAVLRQSDAVTVFAPNDQAFAALPAGTIEAWRKDPTTFRQIVGSYIIRGRVPVGKIGEVSLPSSTITNLNGTPMEQLYVSCQPGGCSVGQNYSGRIMRADVEGGNGFINEIDWVMIRPIVIPP